MAPSRSTGSVMRVATPETGPGGGGTRPCQLVAARAETTAAVATTSTSGRRAARAARANTAAKTRGRGRAISAPAMAPSARATAQPSLTPGRWSRHPDLVLERRQLGFADAADLEELADGAEATVPRAPFDDGLGRRRPDARKCFELGHRRGVEVERSRGLTSRRDRRGLASSRDVDAIAVGQPGREIELVE